MPVADGERRAGARSLARLRAVQALYQIDLVGTDIDELLTGSNFIGFEEDVDGINPLHLDMDFFREIVRGAVSHKEILDPIIEQSLDAGWRLERIDSTLRAVFRAGAYELYNHRDIPARVVIGEYVDLVYDFFRGDEGGVTNAVLDSIARSLRAEEFAA